MSHIGDDHSHGNIDLTFFTAALSRVAKGREAFECLAALVRGLGFKDVSLTIEDNARAGEPRERSWSTLDNARHDRLREIGFGGHDPIRRLARRISDPLPWSFDEWRGDHGAAARALMFDLRGVAIEAGLTTPIWGRGGRLAIVDAFAGTDFIRNLPTSVSDTVFLGAAQTFRVIERLTVQRAQPVLTMRELEILELSAQGLSARSIASRLSIVEPTVKFHFKSIRDKLQARNKAEAVARFAALGPASFQSIDGGCALR